MAKPKFSLTAKPTFAAVVPIPVPGDLAADVLFTFKGRTREQLQGFMESTRDTERLKLDIVMDMVAGWELEDPFDREHVEKLLENYLGAYQAIYETYLRELTEARAKN